MTDQQVPRPIPAPTPVTQSFWDAAKRHELVLQYCPRCNNYQHYPRAICTRCQNFDLEWRRASGRGTVHTWIVVDRAFHPGLRDRVPYITATIDLEEGPRIMANLLDVDRNDVKEGMPVEVAWEDVNPEIALPQFAPVR